MSTHPLSLSAVDNLAIPGRHESRALTDCCPDPDCYLGPAEPVVVLTRSTGRIAAYRCGRCGLRWLCSRGNFP